MENFIKLVRAEIKNIKNVKHGVVNFKTHITGIYGQNGSGKTALIDSMNILKAYLYGKKLDYFYDLINVDSKNCSLNFTFEVEIDKKKYRIFLEVTLKKIKKIIDNEEDGVVSGEIISILYKGDHYQVIIRTKEEDDFVVDTEYTWNEFDRVSVKIPPEKIKLTLKHEVNNHEKD